MIYLIAAIVSSALVSIIMRLSEGYIKNNISMLAVNYAVCVLVAGIHMGLFGRGVGFFEASGALQMDMRTAVVLGVINGFLYLFSFILMQMSVQKNGVVLSAVFMKLGVMVPTVTAVIFFGEIPTAVQICGFVIALAAILLIHLEKEQADVTFKAGLILLLIGGGSGDAMAKVYEELGSAKLEEHFLYCTFISALVLCVLLTLKKKQRLAKEDVLFGVLIGIPNYYSARFLLKSLAEIPAVVAYPTYSVSAILLVAIAGVILFHEKMSGRRKSAIVLVMAALLLLNV